MHSGRGTLGSLLAFSDLMSAVSFHDASPSIGESEPEVPAFKRARTSWPGIQRNNTPEENIQNPPELVSVHHRAEHRRLQLTATTSPRPNLNKTQLQRSAQFTPLSAPNHLMSVVIADFQEAIPYTMHVANDLLLGSEALDHRAELYYLMAVRAGHDDVHVPVTPR